MGLCLALLSTSLAISCAGPQEKVVRHRAIYSPNGEPLSGGPLGYTSCAAALGGWLERLDSAHKGAIDREAFLEDARRQFKAMDLNGDGIITPDVLTRYRTPYAIAPEPGRRAEEERKKPGADSASRTGGGGSHGGGARPPARPGASAGGGGASDTPDPVMSADVNLRLKVNAADFEQHAERVFASLDANHDGQLDRAEVQRWCGDQAGPEPGGGWFDWFGWF